MLARRLPTAPRQLNTADCCPAIPPPPNPFPFAPPLDGDTPLGVAPVVPLPVLRRRLSACLAPSSAPSPSDSDVSPFAISCFPPLLCCSAPRAAALPGGSRNVPWSLSIL